jgi:hypothetical protein
LSKPQGGLLSFLETDDEYFNYNPDPQGIPGQGRWYIYGLFLPDEVLQKVIYQNATQILSVKGIP